MAVALSVHAAAGNTDGDLPCPPGTMVMEQRADYVATERIEGFDTPEQAVQHLVDAAYPGMPRQRFERARSEATMAVLRTDRVRARVIEFDPLLPNDDRTGLVRVEDGTAWLVDEFAICEVDARRWVAR